MARRCPRQRCPRHRQRHLTARPVLPTAGAGGVAVAAAVGTLVAGGGTPAYAVTTHPDGTVTLAVYQSSGIAGANSKLHDLGDRVVVVPSSPAARASARCRYRPCRAKQISVQVSGSSDGSVTVDAQGIPAGDILVLGVSTADGQFRFFPQESTSQEHSSRGQPLDQGRPLNRGQPRARGREPRRFRPRLVDARTHRDRVEADLRACAELRQHPGWACHSRP